MAKVSKLKLYLRHKYGEDYEIHYNARNQPNFSIKGLPSDFENITKVKVFGYETEAKLSNEILTAVQVYKKLKQSQRKVILYKASASTEITMNKTGKGSYSGRLNGISGKLDSFGFGAETASFGITYDVVMEVDVVNKKQYHCINEDGTLGHSKSIASKFQIMDWTQEREDFFEGLYLSMQRMVVKFSEFIDKDPDESALLIDSNMKFLS